MNSKTTRHSHLSLWYTTAAVAAVGGGLACTANEAAALIQITTLPGGGLLVPQSPTLGNQTNGVFFRLDNPNNPNHPLNYDTQKFDGYQFRLQWLNSTSSYFYQVTAGDTLGKQISAFYPYQLKPGDHIGPPPRPKGSFGGPGFIGSTFSAMTLYGGPGNTHQFKWKPGDIGYLGLRFATPGGGPNDFNYGWAKISLDATNGEPKLINFAYDTVANEDPVPPSDVPEPNPLLLLATGVAGLGAYRAWRARRGQRQGSSALEAGASESVTA
jgi:hypothetical protein